MIKLGGRFDQSTESRSRGCIEPIELLRVTRNLNSVFSKLLNLRSVHFDGFESQDLRVSIDASTRMKESVSIIIFNAIQIRDFA
jgi:hypothetical protein